MVFKRRDPRSLLGWMRELVYPTGGFRRATLYLYHRMRRLPDQPHRIARGIWAGAFVSFTPFFGLHFALAALIAWIMRGNIVAALLATAVGNPFTFPVIAVISVELGNLFLGTGVEGVPASRILPVFAHAGVEIWENLIAAFSPGPTHWDRLSYFFHSLFIPYLVGSILPGIVVATVLYALSLSLIGTYQRIETRRRRERAERHRAGAARRLRAGQDSAQGPGGGDSG